MERESKRDPMRPIARPRPAGADAVAAPATAPVAMAASHADDDFPTTVECAKWYVGIDGLVLLCLTN